MKAPERTSCDSSDFMFSCVTLASAQKDHEDMVMTSAFATSTSVIRNPRCFQRHEKTQLWRYVLLVFVSWTQNQDSG